MAQKDAEKSSLSVAQVDEIPRDFVDDGDELVMADEAEGDEEEMVEEAEEHDDALGGDLEDEEAKLEEDKDVKGEAGDAEGSREPEIFSSCSSQMSR